jgi:hypothetical protein
VTFSVAYIGFFYYVFFKNEYSYDHLKDFLVQKRIQKLNLKYKFDSKKYNDLIKERDILTLEMENEHSLLWDKNIPIEYFKY